MLKVKAIVGLVAALVILGVGVWCGLKIRELNQTNAQLNEELMSAKLDLGKAHTQFGEARDKIVLLDKQLQNEIKAHKETIIKYGELLALYNAVGGGTSDSPSPSEEKPPVVDEPTFVPGKIYVAQSGYMLLPFDPPLVFGVGDDRIDITTSLLVAPKFEYPHYPIAEVKYQLHLKVMAQLVETTAENGAINNYINIFEVNSAGEKVGKFELSSFEVVVEDQRKPKFHLWNPKLDVGIVAGFDRRLVYGGDLGISISSFGLSKNDLTLRFVRFSAVFTNEGIGLLASPVLWNIGDPLPLVQNLWISPSVLFNPNTRLFGFGMALSVSM